MKKLPRTYCMDVVAGKLVISEPSSKVQKTVPQPVRVEAETSVSATKNECKQCKQPFVHKARPYPPQLYCNAKCRKKYRNKKKYESKRPVEWKRDGVALVSSCLQCKDKFTYDRQRFGRHKKFCKKACRDVFHKNKYNAKKVEAQEKARPTKSVESVPEDRTCPQCATTFSGKHTGGGRPKKYCTASCCEKWFNNKYKQERKERLAKATVHTFHCRLCKKEAVKQKGNQVYCSLDCRENYYSNFYKRMFNEPVEKLHGVTCAAESSNKVVRKTAPKSGGAFVAKVNEALATLPPEETLPPPIPEDRSAGSLLSAGRTLTEVGLAEGVKDAYGVEIKDQTLRSRGFWFSILLAKHSKDLKDWRMKLEKHGLKSKPSVEKWLLFRGASSTNATASGLKARLDI